MSSIKSLFIGALLISGELLGYPSQAKVVSGEVTLDPFQPGLLLVYSQTGKAIIEWQEFSIDVAEAVCFQLPSMESAILNKVTSALPSVLAGILESNGNVYLINPNGILVTEEGVINTASFLASTLDTHNADFAKGKDLLFYGSSKEAVINKGEITSWNGDVVLLGQVVCNKSSVNAKGDLCVGVGSEILLSMKGTNKISIKRSIDENAFEALKFEITHDGNVLSCAIGESPEKHASKSAHINGRVWLIADTHFPVARH